ncbi:bifunctional adenosylcobinamide kinase/adenosylcobinamide-phosphate guanylyltransferase [Paenibacillus sp. J2TS4]|uniref:bifunctional adenosylcobinamide kinase/adenosylcobinamide-phosphate guanylyltransferase n=1 Tax=Paenibacillus sp. J2TS4 TaxID=2807194 RepID=UPI001B03ED9B|nr:bifunctional adenosylcobinamide kinase/adenosylcobinamide-phosphate guanylyltransferase [Paenibacillus sp. J2TS4]GIP34366.1 adenosylcobinamide kinase/adenosylcobinamide phosphate guanyltransferase [Paenibacillus sp. J2TS4]
MVIFVTGGARSGKSRFAESYAEHLGTSGIYIATAQIYDEEMAERVRQHQSQRAETGFPWKTVEEPYSLAEWLADGSRGDETTTAVKDSASGFTASAALASSDSASGLARDGVVLVDCLSLWLSNWLLRFEGEPDAADRVERKVEELVAALAGYSGIVLVVSNEVGGGIVPEYPLGRLYRDLAGRMNQKVAAVSEQAFLVTAGIPVELKSIAFRMDKR